MDPEKLLLTFPDVTVPNISVNKSLIAEMSNKYMQQIHANLRYMW